MLKNNSKSFAKRGELNPMWRGESVGYGKLHEWVRRRLPKYELCAYCKKEPPKDLANLGKYDRDLNNWTWLCRRCHMASDGRLKKFLSTRQPTKKGNQLYKLRKKNLSGEEHPNSKLELKQVQEIRVLLQKGEKLKDIGAKYNVCFQTISLIKHNKIWKQ